MTVCDPGLQRQDSFHPSRLTFLLAEGNGVARETFGQREKGTIMRRSIALVFGLLALTGAAGANARAEGYDDEGRRGGYERGYDRSFVKDHDRDDERDHDRGHDRGRGYDFDRGREWRERREWEERRRYEQRERYGYARPPAYYPVVPAPYAPPIYAPPGLNLFVPFR